MTRVVLVAPDSRIERHVRSMLADDVAVFAAPDPDSFASKVGRMLPRPELVVLGNQLPRERALALAASVRQFADAMALVSDEPDVIVAAMRSGISEVLPTDVDLDELDSVIARAHEFSMDSAAAQGRSRDQPVRPGRIIAVASPKGGVGKTTIACNVAVALATSEPGRVVLVDLDLQFGDVAASLGLEPHYFLETAVGRAAARDSLVLKTFLTEHPAGFSVLCAPESPATADHITPAQIAHLLKQLSNEFAYVVVDTSPGLSEHTLTVLEHASDAIVITSMDVSSVRGMRKELDVLKELGLLPEARVTVVNFADRSSGLTIADIETAIGARIDIVLPRTKAVALATNRGIPVIIDGPRDKASRNLRLLVRRLESSLTRKSWREAARKEKVS